MSGHDYSDPRRDRIRGRRRGGRSSPQFLPNPVPQPEWLSSEQIASERRLCSLMLRRLRDSAVNDADYPEILREYWNECQSGRILGPIGLDHDLFWIPDNEDRKTPAFQVLVAGFLRRRGREIKNAEDAIGSYIQAASDRSRHNDLMGRITSFILQKQTQLDAYFVRHSLNRAGFFELFRRHHDTSLSRWKEPLEWLSRENFFNSNNMSRGDLGTISLGTLVEIARKSAKSDLGDIYRIAGGSDSQFHLEVGLVFSDFRLQDGAKVPNALLDAIRIFQIVEYEPSAGGGQRGYLQNSPTVGRAWGLIPLVEFRFNAPPGFPTPSPGGSPRTPAPQPSPPAPQPSPDDDG